MMADSNRFKNIRRYKEDPPQKTPPENLLSKLSEIRIVNDFSIDSQYFDRSSILEQSLEQDIKTWQQLYKVDQNVVQKVEKDVKDIDNQIIQLATQFDICIGLYQKAENKFIEFQQLMKGIEFTKFSRSNCKKSAKRLIFYCPFLDAICWKSKKSKLPSTSQMIPIDQIIQIHTNYQKYRQTRKGFNISNNYDVECFIAIEARNNVRLELLADSKHHQQIYVKTLNLLLNHQEDNTQSDLFLEQYGTEINTIRRNLDKSKDLFINAIEKLQQTFISSTQTLLSQEKEKIKTIKKKSQHFMIQNRMQMEDLNSQNGHLKTHLMEIQMERDYLEQRVNQLQDNYNFKQAQIKSSNNPQMLSIQTAIHDILSLNGDQITNESQYEYGSKDYFQDSLNGLNKLRLLFEASQQTEIDLREYQMQIIREKQKLQQEVDQLVNDHNENILYITELENINNILQNKLESVSKTLESKEIQFRSLIEDMQQLQTQFPKLNDSKQLKLDNEKLKDALQHKLIDLRGQIIKEEKSWLNIFGHILGFLIFQICRNEFNTDQQQMIQLLNCKMIDSANKCDPNIQLIHLQKFIQQKIQFFQKNHKEQFEKVLKEQLLAYQGLLPFNQKINHLHHLLKSSLRTSYNSPIKVMSQMLNKLTTYLNQQNDIIDYFFPLQE
ncbi:hypothetical protein pb186bvf_002584 [Paramecium bursaria]